MSRYDPTLRETRTCRYCKKRFKFYLTLARNNSKNPGKYCSRECSDKDSRVTLKCAHCKKRFTTWACMAKKRKYCSHECAGVARNRKPRTCIHCGKQYMAARVEASWLSLESTAHSHARLSTRASIAGSPWLIQTGIVDLRDCLGERSDCRY